MSDLLEQQAQQRAVLAALAEDDAAEAQLFARRAGHLAEAARLWGADRADGAKGAEQFLSVELAGTCLIGQTRANNRVTAALRLSEVFTAAFTALQQGRLRVHLAEVLLSRTVHCTEQVQREVEERVLEELLLLGTGDAIGLVETTVLEVEAEIDAQLTADRQAAARRGRRVWVRPYTDGMAQVGASMSGEQGRRWVLDFDELVRAQKLADTAKGIVRTQDQRQADVFAELPSRHLALIQALQQGTVTDLLAPAGTAGQLGALSVQELAAELLRLPVRDPRVVNVHVPMTTLLERDQRPGHLEGHGAIAAEHARLMVPIGGLRALFTDSHGQPIAIDPVVLPPTADPELIRARLLAMLGPRTVLHAAEPRHDPSGRLSRLIEFRDLHCIGIGCQHPAHACDLDHDLRYPDGPTAYWNVSAKSRRCHRAKHAGWTVTRAHTGQISWTSPLGHAYTRPGVWRAPPPITVQIDLRPPRPWVHDDHDPEVIDPEVIDPPAEQPLHLDAPPPAPRTWDDEPPF